MPVPHSSQWLRFQSPLIKPDVQFSRIRSRTRSCLRPRKAGRSQTEASEALGIPQPLVREAHEDSEPHLVLAAMEMIRIRGHPDTVQRRYSDVSGQCRPSFHWWRSFDSLLVFVHRGVECEDDRNEWFQPIPASHCERMGEIGLAFRTGGSNAKDLLFVAGRVTEYLRSS